MMAPPSSREKKCSREGLSSTDLPPCSLPTYFAAPIAMPLGLSLSFFTSPKLMVFTWVQNDNLKIVTARGGQFFGSDVIYHIDTTNGFSVSSNFFDELSFNTGGISTGDVNKDGHLDIIRCVYGPGGCKAFLVLFSLCAYNSNYNSNSRLWNQHSNTSQRIQTKQRSPRVLLC